MAKRKPVEAVVPNKWPADSVERWPVAKLTAYAKNPRTHSSEQIDQIAASIGEWGWTQAVLVDEDGMILAGHGRLLAAEKLGITDVPVMVARGWTMAQKRAYVIADNQITLNAGWDEPLLRAELGDLAKMNFDLSLTGFDDVRLATFIGGFGGETDPDETPEVEKVAISKVGDLWQLGRHRLLCGNATEAMDIAKLSGTTKSSVMITDPPYGVDYGNIRDSIRRSGRGGTKFKDIENDDLDGKSLQIFLEATLRSALPHLINNPAFYLWHPMLTQGTFFAAAAAADILIHRQIIWVKPSLILGRGDYHWRHELCFYGWIKGKRCEWYSGRDQTTVWEIGRENDGVHPTQKPVECMKRPIENNSKPGDAVYDPFVGSGTTIIAAEMTGRIALAIEIEPIYVDVAVRRWQKFTGEKAVLAGTKRTFDHIEKERSTKKAPRKAPLRRRGRHAA